MLVERNSVRETKTMIWNVYGANSIQQFRKGGLFAYIGTNVRIEKGTYGFLQHGGAMST